MNWFKKIIQNFGCNHEYEFVRNIYGDEINQCGGYRSLWQCSKCGKYKYCKRLYNPTDTNTEKIHKTNLLFLDLKKRLIKLMNNPISPPIAIDKPISISGFPIIL